jgi:hypothetical protein
MAHGDFPMDAWKLKIFSLQRHNTGRLLDKILPEIHGLVKTSGASFFCVPIEFNIFFI